MNTGTGFNKSGICIQWTRIYFQVMASVHLYQRAVSSTLSPTRSGLNRVPAEFHQLTTASLRSSPQQLRQPSSLAHMHSHPADHNRQPSISSHGDRSHPQSPRIKYVPSSEENNAESVFESRNEAPTLLHNPGLGGENY